MRLDRKVIVGHWKDAAVQKASARGRAPAPGVQNAHADSRRFRRQHAGVAVTQADKVGAQLQFDTA